MRDATKSHTSGPAKSPPTTPARRSRHLSPPYARKPQSAASPLKLTAERGYHSSSKTVQRPNRVRLSDPSQDNDVPMGSLTATEAVEARRRREMDTRHWEVRKGWTVWEEAEGLDAEELKVGLGDGRYEHFDQENVTEYGVSGLMDGRNNDDDEKAGRKSGAARSALREIKVPHTPIKPRSGKGWANLSGRSVD